MSAFDDMTKSIRDVYKRLAISGKRAAAVTRLRLELSGLDRERRLRVGAGWRCLEAERDLTKFCKTFVPAEYSIEIPMGRSLGSPGPRTEVSVQYR